MTCACPQARVHAKEESVRKYQELLAGAREDLAQQAQRHEQELRMLQDKLHAKNDDAFHRFKQHMKESMQSKPSHPVPTNEQVQHVFCLLYICLFSQSEVNAYTHIYQFSFETSSIFN
jgi:hypothetical protein